MDVPTEMTAIVADSAGPDPLKRLRVARIPVPKPKRGEVLVKISFAPCNPADLLYLEGRYGIERPLPATPGFEGSGTVVASGGGMLGRWMLGKRVACGGHDCSGTWAEYCLTASNACLPLAKDLTLEQGAAALANPTTALAFAALVARGKHRAYVQTAAAGQLGRMILVAARDRGIEGIHIVRRAEQAEALKALDAKHILISSSPTFAADLRALAAELRATIALDAIAGAMTGTLVTALPKESEVVVYGALSGDPCGSIDPMALAFRHQRVRGFEIAAYIEDLGLIGAFRFATKAQRYVRTGKFTTTVTGTVPLADAPAGLASYVERMSDGKVLLAP